MLATWNKRGALWGGTGGTHQGLKGAHTRRQMGAKRIHTTDDKHGANTWGKTGCTPGGNRGLHSRRARQGEKGITNQGANQKILHKKI